MPGAVRFALAMILAHVVVQFFHGAAHGRLGIGLSAAEKLFVGIVIFIAPLLAGILLAMKLHRAGAALLVVSMAGSFLFGVYKHFVAAGLDNVASHPFRGWGLTFQATAVLLGLTEALGCWAGVQVLKRGSSES